MKTINTNEEISDEVFIFVNELNPMTSHNLRLTKSFTSGALPMAVDNPQLLQKYVNGTLRYLPYQPTEMDPIGLSPFFLTAINDYRIEYDAERYRELNFGTYPSRLSAVFAFADWATCEAVSTRYGWPLASVRKFKILPHRLIRVAKVNMEVVSLARHAFRAGTWETTDPFWHHYWNGGGEMAIEVPGANFQRTVLSAGVFWELLIEGRVVLVDDD